MVKSNPDGSITFDGEIEYLGKSRGEPISGKVNPKSVDRNWTNKLKDVICIMCRRQMTVKLYENPPYYCYKCNDEAEGVFGNG